MRRTIPPVLAVLAAMAAACGGTPSAETATTDAVVDGGFDFPRVFEHAEWFAQDEYYAHLPAEVDIPAKPERIVSLAVGEYTDALLALGITPVGTGTYAAVTGSTDDPGAWPPAIADAATDAGLVSVGLGWEPNIEMIVGMQPDLIIGSTGAADADARLGQIAPLVEPAGSRDWRDTFRAVAYAVGAAERAEEVIADWAARAAEIGEQYGPVKVALIRPRPDVLWVYGPPSNAGTILAEVGLEMIPGPEGSSITDDAPGAIGEISIERLSELSAAEHLFVITYSVDDAQLQGYLDDPLWQQLPAVQAGNVHLVEGTAWTNHGPLGASEVLDEIEAGLGAG